MQHKNKSNNFQLHPNLITRINRLSSPTHQNNQYHQHKSIQKNILNALDHLRISYLHQQQLIIQSTNQAINLIHSKANQLHSYLDHLKENQLDCIQPQLQLFIQQKKLLKNMLLTNHYHQISLINGQNIIHKINNLKQSIEKFSICQFKNIVDKIQSIIYPNTKSINQHAIQNVINLSIQPQQHKQDQVQSKYIHLQNHFQQLLINKNIEPQQIYSHEIILDNVNKQQTQNEQSIIIKKQKILDKSHSAFNITKLQTLFPQLKSYHQHHDNLKTLQSVRSQSSFLSKNTHRSSTNKHNNCLEVLRKQKMKYDQIKNNLHH